MCRDGFYYNKEIASLHDVPLAMTNQKIKLSFPLPERSQA